jgi:hypothetical protein
MTNFDYYIKGGKADEGCEAWREFQRKKWNFSGLTTLDRYNEWLLEEHKEPPILDDTERKYLSNIIKPFRDKVVNITKLDDGDYYRISVKLYNNGVDHLFLPKFDCSAKMYMNMKPNRRYTLKELNL